MNDFERRLREALAAAAAGEPPPPGLMQRVRRRHRRHLLRAGGGCVAVVTALALVVPPVAHALRSVPNRPGQAGPGPVTAPSCPSAALPSSRSSGTGYSRYLGCPQPLVRGTSPSPSARAAPGTLLRDCQSENATAADIAGYQRQSVRAGPVWFVGAREKGNWPVSRRTGRNLLGAVGANVAVQAGATAVVRVEPAARSRFRFLYGFNNTNQYSLRAGKPGMTLAACSASELGSLTVFWVGYLNDGLRCVPLEVSQPGQRPIRVTLSASGGTCTA